MGLKDKYLLCREGGWKLWVRPGSWSQGLWMEILRHLKDQSAAERPQVRRFRYPQGENGVEFYLKIYDSRSVLPALKDLFRDSKAFRALKRGEALGDLGFHVPPAWAAGERRTRGFLQRAFLLTASVEGLPIHLYLLENCSPPLDAGALRKKRDYLKRFALEVRRLHASGFVHGDLTPSNVLVSPVGGSVVFFLTDNDRTRCYPPWLPHLFWRRNLVQLNRFVLPGISLQDRFRFLRFYLGRAYWTRSDRRLIHWLEKKTRERLQEFGQDEPQASFRRLMRWDRPFNRYNN